MGDDRENYCRLIGLNPLNESKYTAEEIKRRIGIKETKWIREQKDTQNDSFRRYQFGIWLGMIEDMNATMGDAFRRAKEFEDGRKLLRTLASKLSKDCIVLHDGSKVLLQGAAEGLAKRVQWDDVKKEDLISESGIRLTAVPPIIGQTVASAYKGLIEVNCFTPVDILNDLIGNPILDIKVNRLSDDSNPAQIRQAFDVCERRANNVQSKDFSNQDAYIQSLRALKLAIGSDKDLVDLMKYGLCMKALGPVKTKMDDDYNHGFTGEYIDEIVRTYLQNPLIDRTLAISILEEYCFKKKYKANFSRKESNLTLCPKCKAYVEDSPSVLCCSFCGSTLKTKCPKCETMQAFGNKACTKCGFNFQMGFDRAKALETRFRLALKKGMVDEAANALREIEATYATYPTIQSLRNELKPMRSKYNSIVEEVNQSQKLGRYINLKNVVEDAQIEIPNILSNTDLKRKYDDAVRRTQRADQFCAEAARSTKLSDSMKLYMQAAEACPDHDIAKSKLREYPPGSPADAMMQVRDKSVLIKFARPADYEGITYCIYRSRGSLPVVTEDTIALAEIPGNIYQDKSIDPGVDCYYAIYSKRWGVLSKEAAFCGPATVFLEVENISIEAIEDGLKLMYERPKGCDRVRIWRKEGTTVAGVGDEVEILHNGETVIFDYGLKGGVRYHYLFVAEYKFKNRTERTTGTQCSYVTPKLPEMVSSVEVRRNKSDGSFSMRWSSKEKVVLYATTKRINRLGSMTKIEDLNTWMSKLEVAESYPDGARFFLPDGAVQFIYPAIMVGKSALVGKPCTVENLRPFRDVERRVSGGNCDITMTWPKTAESAVVIVKSSEPASSPNDLDGEKITVSREAYEKDRMIRISMGDSKKRVVTIFASYEYLGEKYCSRGMSLDVFAGIYTKVKYTMVKGTGRNIDMRFEANPDVKVIPPMAAVHVKEGIPLKIWDGENIWESKRGTPLTNGVATMSIQTESKVDLRKVRLFFTNNEDYNQFRLIHPVYKE